MKQFSMKFSSRKFHKLICLGEKIVRYFFDPGIVKEIEEIMLKNIFYLNH